MESHFHFSGSPSLMWVVRTPGMVFVCVCVFERGKEKERGVAFEDAPCVTPLSSLDTAWLLLR